MTLAAVRFSQYDIVGRVSCFTSNLLDPGFDDCDDTFILERSERGVDLHPDAFSGGIPEYKPWPQEVMDQFLAHERQLFIEQLEQRYEQADSSSKSLLYWELRSFRGQPPAPPFQCKQEAKAQREHDRQCKREAKAQRERDRAQRIENSRLRLLEEMERNRIKYAAYERDWVEQRCAAGWKYWQCGNTTYFGPMPPPYDGVWKEVQRQR